MINIKNKLLDYEGEISRDRLHGTDWPSNAFTMIGLIRLNNIEFCIEQIHKEKIEGDFIECGVWRGGACIFMKHLSNELNLNRKVFVADSFCGLPMPDEKYPYDKDDKFHTFQELKISEETVKNNFKQFNLLDNEIVFVKGWFKDTLHKIENKFSILRLDGDMYESTMDSLNGLYHKLNSGGYIIIDDYDCVPGCNQAVEDFRSKNNITEPMIKIDWCGVYWKKY